MASSYQKFSHLEHILARPDTYVGSLKQCNGVQWVLDDGKMVERALNYIPALFKLFDEILVNAIDQCSTDPSVNKIKVTVTDSSIEILNTGVGIPIEKHEKYDNQWIPEMIFGELLTSSNYNDNEQRTTGGRNGYGAKLTNVFSTEFSIDVASTASKKRYQQTWTSNMSSKNKPSVTKYSNALGYTKVTFTPDLARFNLASLTDDVKRLFERRTYDACACTSTRVKVYYNGTQLPCTTFEKYVDCYIGDKTTTERVFAKQTNWDVCVASSSQGFRQVSFVNGINTSAGGSHVDYVVNHLIKHIIDYASTKHKDVKLKPTHVRDNVFVFVNSTLINPSFSSQTKTECTSRYRDFGSTFAFSADSLKKIYKMSFIQDAIALAKHKEVREMNRKTDGKKTSVLRGLPKLEDANKAGTIRSNECTLILTEGDSAKTFAISGLSVVGRDLYGVFPLRGKLLNVREATVNQLANNEEINAVKKILGLKNDVVYNSTRELRYGRVMVLTDADVDGSHIKGLFINFIHFFWPSLMNLKSFITSMRTPILKATLNGRVMSFYNENDYQGWKTTVSERWNVKYYKGLGTSTASEAREYFKEMTSHLVVYEHDSDASIELAFKKTLADQRKEWIKDGTVNKESLDANKKVVTTSDFVHKDLRWFSIADNVRSIPSMVDGLKPSQRKVLFACRNRPGNPEIKISQLSGIVSSATCYHHGEQSLMAAIIGMAQNFVGSNNLNLLEPKGQFGTRLMGGKDAASPRYIFTKLTPDVSKIFREEDDHVLEYAEDDGVSVEPVFFVPILPMVLVNGCDGIGTGYSTSIPCYKPADVSANIRRWLDGKLLVELSPWYDGFKGAIEKCGHQKYQTRGIWSLSDGTLTITELPIGKWTADYKEHLERMVDDNKIDSFVNHSTETSVRFVAEGVKPDCDIAHDFKLSTTLHTSNMHCFDEHGVIQRYSSPNEIIDAFARVRLSVYEKRKAHQLKTWSEKLAKLSDEIRFMKLVMDNSIVVFRQTKQQVHRQLMEHSFKELIFDALLGIKLDAFTTEHIESKQDHIVRLERRISELATKTTRDLWREDLV